MTEIAFKWNVPNAYDSDQDKKRDLEQFVRDEYSTETFLKALDYPQWIELTS